MNDLMHQLLLGHLLGALDDDEHERVDALLEHDERCCEELLQWRRRLAPLEAIRPEIEPPPDLAARTCHYLAVCVPALVESQDWYRRFAMSSHPAPPSRATRFGWLDAAVVILLLVIAVSMILPAIDSSRFQTRLASCQDGLRQFGLALSQYCDQQQNALGRMAAGGRLTHAGVFAAGLIQDGFSTDTQRPLCPDAWLAAQGVLCKISQREIPRGVAKQATRPGTAALENNPPLVQISPCRYVAWHNDPHNDWPGAWRDGMTDGRRIPPAPADVPLLADAPSADPPGQIFAGHRGQGRNVLFEDGRVDFLPSMPTRDTSIWLLPSARSTTGSISVPVVYVNGR